MGKESHPINSHATHKRQRFSKDFKLNAVALLKAGQKPTTQLALELVIRRNLLYKWAETLVAHGGDVNTVFNGLGRQVGKPQDPLKVEIKQLKRALARMTDERDMLKKAEAYFIKANQTKAHKSKAHK